MKMIAVPQTVGIKKIRCNQLFLPYQGIDTFCHRSRIVKNATRIRQHGKVVILQIVPDVFCKTGSYHEDILPVGDGLVCFRDGYLGSKIYHNNLFIQSRVKVVTPSF